MGLAVQGREGASPGTNRVSHIAEEDAVPLGYIWGAESVVTRRRGAPGPASARFSVSFTHLPVQARAPLISGSLTCDSLLSPQGLGPSWPPLLCSVSHSTAGSKPQQNVCEFAVCVHLCLPHTHTHTSHRHVSTTRGRAWSLGFPAVSPAPGTVPSMCSVHSTRGMKSFSCLLHPFLDQPPAGQMWPSQVCSDPSHIKLNSTDFLPICYAWTNLQERSPFPLEQMLYCSLSMGKEIEDRWKRGLYCHTRLQYLKKNRGSYPHLFIHEGTGLQTGNMFQSQSIHENLGSIGLGFSDCESETSLVQNPAKFLLFSPKLHRLLENHPQLLSQTDCRDSYLLLANLATSGYPVWC